VAASAKALSLVIISLPASNISSLEKKASAVRRRRNGWHCLAGVISHALYCMPAEAAKMLCDVHCVTGTRHDISFALHARSLLHFQTGISAENEMNDSGMMWRVVV